MMVGWLDEGWILGTYSSEEIGLDEGQWYQKFELVEFCCLIINPITFKVAQTNQTLFAN